jgi:hypothetical protein
LLKNCHNDKITAISLKSKEKTQEQGMTDRVRIRQEAYNYILHKLSLLQIDLTSTNWLEIIEIDELRLLKEGIADPSESLVAALKELLKGLVNNNEIDSYLVEPFNTPV